jgi:hypothetical protein
VPNVERLAAEFATQVRVLYEWEGFADSPLEEAQSALSYLAGHPNTPFASYIHLLVAHRYVCATEQPFGKTPTLDEEAAKRVPAELALARQSTQPLIRFVAEDFAQRPRCYDHIDMGR